MKMGLENIWKLTESLGNPQLRFPSVHIAGTNGKGSTSSMIASMLRAAGYRTGLYTSPHLVHFTERIRVDGKPISERKVVRSVEELKPVVDRLEATFFEATTAVAFDHFADERIDIGVIETGLGGRLDATNILSPQLSVITTIGFDHTEHLGHTLPAIAGEKGGIIKPFTPCVSGVSQVQADRRLRQIAKENRSPFIRTASVSGVAIREYSTKGTIFDFTSRSHRYRNLHLSLPGAHQVENARIALIAVNELADRCGFDRISEPAIRDGLAHVQEYSGLRGRLDFVDRRRRIVMDVAHNPDGIGALTKALHSLVDGRFLVVFGVMSDKDFPVMLKKLNPVTRRLIAVSPSTGRALSCQKLVEEARRQGISSLIGGSVAEAMGVARKDLRRGETMLVTGSHYVVGDALKCMKFENT